mmetsp:Transcript_2111/g.3775  ORF Transcript_2111/g.3775 Transcript_2111/m.3775 type:complete len:652 (+) Transcript_2111:10-1965(+)
MTTEDSAAERKRKRLEAWKLRRQQQQQQPTAPPPPPPVPAVKVSLSLNAKKLLKHKKKKETPSNSNNNNTVVGSKATFNPFGAVDDDDDDDDDDENSDNEGRRGMKGKLSLGLGFSLYDDDDQQESKSAVATSTAKNTPTTSPDKDGEPPKKRRRKGRWDAGPTTDKQTPAAAPAAADNSGGEGSNLVAGDALDKFMEKLEAGALGSVATQVSGASGTDVLSIDVGGSLMRVSRIQQQPPKKPQLSPLSGGVITSEQIAKLTGASSSNTKQPSISQNKQANPEALYTHSDWESDAQSATGGGGGMASEPETDDEEEEKARRAFIEALKSAPGPAVPQNDEDTNQSNDNNNNSNIAGTTSPYKPSLAAEVKNEKHRREQMLRNLEREAEEARTLAEKSAAPELGRLYNDTEGGIMEEAERNLDAAMAAPDALQVLAELNKKKELKSVDHSKIDYIPFKKNLYIVPRALAKLSNDEVIDLRAKLKVKVRGHGAPAPVTSFEQCGLSERILKVLEKQGIRSPFPVQAQCIPCIMAGRDTIGIAKTGSGKTLSYLLPLLRHIMIQPPLGPNESGPIGLILAPARELAYQIHIVCKAFAKPLGLNTNAFSSSFWLPFVLLYRTSFSPMRSVFLCLPLFSGLPLCMVARVLQSKLPT